MDRTDDAANGSSTAPKAGITCAICGAPAPTNANFCPTCGNLLNSTARPPEARWEVCEVRYRDTRRRFGLRNAYEFEAVALGPNGKQTVDTTGKISGRFFQTIEAAIPAIEAMTDRLIAGGWQSLPSSLPLNLPRFIRPVSRPS